mmetsp:Transcript_95364/g.273465  ORF Transcript_95364/g.273465 Transcript_95364/m.273465 type:complete len:271 (-) Transcript_95364:82-894(-)
MHNCLTPRESWRCLQPSHPPKASDNFGDHSLNRKLCVPARWPAHASVVAAARRAVPELDDDDAARAGAQGRHRVPLVRQEHEAITALESMHSLHLRATAPQRREHLAALKVRAAAEHDVDREEAPGIVVVATSPSGDLRVFVELDGARAHVANVQIEVFQQAPMLRIHINRHVPKPVDNVQELIRQTTRLEILGSNNIVLGLMLQCRCSYQRHILLAQKLRHAHHLRILRDIRVQEATPANPGTSGDAWRRVIRQSGWSNAMRRLQEEAG